MRKLTREEVKKILADARENGEIPDLREADLRDANLRGADLSGADLSGANLRGTDGLFATAQLGKHDAIAAGGNISIGCKTHTYAEWLENGEEIGRSNGYTDAEIARYMAWIKLVVPWLSEEEAKIAVKEG